MFTLNNVFRKYSENEIRKLRGGPKHNFQYFLVTTNDCRDVATAVIHAKLENQMGSQLNLSDHPKGYEPFKIFDRIQNFCLARFTLKVPTLAVSYWNNLIVDDMKTPACILRRPNRGSDEYALLMRESRRSKYAHRIRTYAAFNDDYLATIISLFSLCGTGDACMPATIAGQVERLERLLSWTSEEELRRIDSLLSMPEPRPSPPAIPAAA